MTTDANIAKARRYISNTTDGPLANFVLIGRALELARSNLSLTEEDIMNALHDELTERGMLVEGDVEVPGS